MRTTDLFGRPIKDRQAAIVASATKPVGRTRSVDQIKVDVHHGECAEVLKRLAEDGVQFDACVTDPPYHLAPLHKRFSNSARTEATIGPGVFGRHARGFMGQKWDGGDVAFRAETWAAVRDVLRPGAFLVAFGGTRTYHRLATAIEDAGFVIQDMIAWAYGSGFPKRRDTLKPAMEPICFAYKPGDRRTMHVDECRIGTTVETWPNSRSPGYFHRHARGEATMTTGDAPPGRWPANICHDGSDEVVDLFPESESREPADLSMFRSRRSGYGMTGGGGGKGDSGSAARFFYCAKPDAEERQGSDHPTVKPVALMRWLVRLVAAEGGTVLDPFAGTGTTGAAAVLEGVDAALIERDDRYVADIHRKLDYYRNQRSRTLY